MRLNNIPVGVSICVRLLLPLLLLFCYSISSHLILGFNLMVLFFEFYMFCNNLFYYFTASNTKPSRLLIFYNHNYRFAMFISKVLSF